MANTQLLYNFSFGNASHVGLVRKVNEDYFGSFETKNGYIFLVCDGMGGHVGGAKASQIAVDTIRDYLQQIDYTTPVEALEKSITAANQAILDYADKNPELKGMGTTCVAVLIQGANVYYAHVGDSRIYLLSGKKLIRITKDHSFVQNMVDLGAMSEEEAEKHPRKNEITNALGLPNMKPPTVSTAPIKAAKGDLFLLCSDGLTGMVGDKKIESVLNNNMELHSKANMLIDLANYAGGTDNITLQIVGFNQSPYKKTVLNFATPDNTSKKIKKSILHSRRFYLLVGMVVVIGLGLVITSQMMLSPDKKATPILDSTKVNNPAYSTDSVSRIKAIKSVDSPQLNHKKNTSDSNQKKTIQTTSTNVFIKGKTKVEDVTIEAKPSSVVKANQSANKVAITDKSIGSNNPPKIYR